MSIFFKTSMFWLQQLQIIISLRIWVGESLGNYRWAVKLGLALCREYQKGRGRSATRSSAHATEKVLRWLQERALRSFPTPSCSFPVDVFELYSNRNTCVLSRKGLGWVGGQPFKTRMTKLSRRNEDNEPNFRKKRRSKLRVCHLAMPDEFKKATAVEVQSSLTPLLLCQAYRDYYFSKRLVMKMEWPCEPSWWSKRLAKVAKKRGVQVHWTSHKQSVLTEDVHCPDVEWALPSASNMPITWAGHGESGPEVVVDVLEVQG